MSEGKKPAKLSENIAAYDIRRQELEVDHFGKWVVFYDEQLAGIYDEFQDAAGDAVERFGIGPYLIKQVGEPSIIEPSCLRSISDRFMPETNCGFPTPEELQLVGPTLGVRIGFSIISPNARLWPALIDTGARDNCIDVELATALKLPVIGTQNVAGVGGVTTVNAYLGLVEIPELESVIWGRFYGAYLGSGGQYHRMLLGRSFLVGVTMRYDGNSGSVHVSRFS